MKTLLLFVTILLSLTINAQINIQWESRFDNANAVDFSRGIVLDATGNVFVTGTTYNGSDFDIVTIKYDPNGNELWQSTFDGPANGLDETIGLVIDSNGDVIVAGVQNTTGADYDPIAIKYNSVDGSVAWTHVNAGTANYDQIRDVTIDANDNVIIVGALEQAIGNQNFLTISISPTGTQNWSRIFNSAGSDRDVANAVTVDASNNVYVTGESFGANDLDFVTIKYNASSAGATLWTNTFDGTTYIDSPKSITVDAAGNTIVTGTSYRDVVVEEDILTLKISPTGVSLWNMVYSGTAEDFDVPNHVTTDNLNNIYVTGKVKSTSNAEDFFVARYRPDGTEAFTYLYQSPGGGYDEAKVLNINSNYEIYVSGYSFLSATNHDYLTMRMDTTGTVLWQTRFDGPASNSDQMVAMQLDNGGNIFITGSSRGAGTNRDYSTIKYCQLTTVASNDTAVCIGESVNLFASGGSNITWALLSGDPITPANFSCTSCPNPIATPGSTSVYTVSSTSGSGCVDYDTVTIVVNPLPGPTITADGPTTFCIGDSVTLTADTASMYNWSTTESTQSIVANTTGTYSLTVTDSMGCQNSTNIFVDVNDLPIVDAGADQTVCPGEDVTVSGSGGVTYEWYSLPNFDDTIYDGVAFTPAFDTDYIMIGTDGNGCQNTDTLSIALYPFPQQVVITRDSANYMLLSNFTMGNSWFQDGVEINYFDPILHYDDTVNFGDGEYYIVYTDGNGCSTVSDTIIILTEDLPQDTTTIDSTESIFEHQNLMIQIYPNPFVNQIKLEFENPLARKISIYTLEGKLVELHELVTASTILELDQLHTGSYLLLVQDEFGRSARKIIIKK